MPSLRRSRTDQIRSLEEAEDGQAEEREKEKSTGEGWEQKIRRKAEHEREFKNRE